MATSCPFLKKTISDLASENIICLVFKVFIESNLKKFFPVDISINRIFKNQIRQKFVYRRITNFIYLKYQVNDNIFFGFFFQLVISSFQSNASTLKIKYPEKRNMNT